MEVNFLNTLKRKRIYLLLANIASFTVMIICSHYVASSDIRNLTINLICAVIMQLVLAEGSKSIFKAYTLIYDLKGATKLLHKLYTEQTNELDCEILLDKPFFSSKTLKEQFKEYDQEYHRLNQKYPDTKKCDINDYLNEDLFNLYIQKNLTDLIPGILTALGIAGTFIGLMVGLSDFKIDNVDIDQMQLNISLLLNGIKTAFLTSIFGVILSLIFNGFYRFIYYNLEKALDEFIMEFEKFIPSMANSAVNEIISYNRTQLAVTETIADVIADKINEAFKPTIEGFEQMANEFKNHVISTHDESLEKIVDAFVNNMNESLGDQFKTLGLTIEKLNNSQISNAEKIQASINHICETSDKLSEINEMLNSAIRAC